MRFQVSQVMDAIELRLTTDVTGAQAVVDLGKVVRWVELDGGRPVNLVRVGMVVDALSRYLVDGGALLYGVVERSLLSDGEFTSKERMVLSRWADDGLVEVMPAVGDRVAEIADLAGLPMVVPGPEPDQRDLADLAERFGWPDGGAGRMLRLTPRRGAAALRPVEELPAAGDGADTVPAIGRAKVSVPEQPEAAAGDEAGDEATANTAGDENAAADEAAAQEEAAAEAAGGDATSGGAAGGDGAAADQPGGTAAELPLPVQVFTARDAGRGARVRLSRHRSVRLPPNGAYAARLARQWRCDGFECPAFGEHRRYGQPVPRLRDEIPVCPRHDEPVIDAGPRPPSYPVSIVVDDLPRRRLVVRGGEPVPVGRADSDPEVVSVAPWLHRAAENWISPVHLRLEAGEEGLVVVDLSGNGTLVWQRSGPDDPGTTRTLRHEPYLLRDWDSVELYTGIELMHGNRRTGTLLGWEDPPSVLMDAPTAAHRQVASDG